MSRSLCSHRSAGPGPQGARVAGTRARPQGQLPALPLTSFPCAAGSPPHAGALFPAGQSSRGDPSDGGDATRNHVACRGRDPACVPAILGPTWPQTLPSGPAGRQTLPDGARDAEEEPRGTGRPPADPTGPAPASPRREGRQGLQQCPLRSVQCVRQGSAPAPPRRGPGDAPRPHPSPRRCGARQHLRKGGHQVWGFGF